jgi:hypothetical protein
MPLVDPVTSAVRPINLVLVTRASLHAIKWAGKSSLILLAIGQFTHLEAALDGGIAHLRESVRSAYRPRTLAMARPADKTKISE